MAKSLIQISGNGGSVYLGVSELDLKGVLGLRSVVVGGENVGKTAARIVAQLNSGDTEFLVNLTGTGQACKPFSTYYVFATYGRVVSVSAYLLKNGGLEKVVFNGDFATLESKLNPANTLKAYEGKLIRFTYNAGSTPGSIRIVRLDKVSGSGDNVSLAGTDLGVEAKGSEKGYRSFKLSNVAGEIEILN